VYLNCDQCLTSHHVAKFRDVISTGPKVITANRLNCKPFFLIFIVKTFLGGATHISDVVCVSKPCYSLAYVKFEGQHHLRAEIWFSDKVDFGWVKNSSIN